MKSKLSISEDSGGGGSLEDNENNNNKSDLTKILKGKITTDTNKSSHHKMYQQMYQTILLENWNCV